MRPGHIFLLILFFLSGVKALAQEPADALRYSFTTSPGGTARNQAIGGAGASLGGEFTSLFINPAGLGFYKTGDFAFTPSLSFKNSASTYRGTSDRASDNGMNISTTGFVWGAPSYKSSGIKSFAIGLGVNRLADFRNTIDYKGTSHTSSYSEKYLEELADNQVSDPNDAASNFPYGSSLAFNTYLIDTVSDANGQVTGYRTMANPATGLLQENHIQTKGGITELSLGAALNVNEKVYFGASLSLPFLKYERIAGYRESDATTDKNNNFNYFTANENLTTKGIGLGGKLGMIYKPTEDIRLGLVFYSPVFYGLTDEYVTEVTTDLEGYGGQGVKHQSSTDLDITGGQPLESRYNLTTPWRAVISGTWLFHSIDDVQGQKGFITADIEYVNYKNAGFKATSGYTDDIDYYRSLTDLLSQLYRSAINARIGGELKFNTLMVRLGGAYYSNPYQNEKGGLTRLTTGVGYRNKGIFLDLAYVYTLHKDIHYPYLLEDKPNVPAYLKNRQGTIAATIGFKL